MRISKTSWISGFLFFVLPYLGFSADLETKIRLRPGEVGLVSFLEMASEELDLQIDVSGVDIRPLETVFVPDTGPISPERAKALVLTALYLGGYTWIHDTATDFYRVLRLRDARDQEIPIITDAALLPDSDLLVTYMMAIEHAPPEFIARNLRSFMPVNGRVIPDVTTASVVITDSARNISKLQKLVRPMDTPQVGEKAKEWLRARSKAAEAPCSGPGSDSRSLNQGVLIALFSLIALVIGFLARGYVIRRIEGGL